MTRIIAGRLRSLSLEVPPSGTRPTTDRVREALFSAVESRLDLAGTAVLDLFAGSGALGLEALSRGAATLDAIESSPHAARVLERNLASARRRLDLGAEAVRVNRGRLPGAVDGPCPRADGFDLVLVDPPYEDVDALVPPILEALGRNGWLSEIAHVVVESSARGPATAFPAGLALDFSRSYGETRIEIAVWGPDQADADGLPD